MNQLIRAAFVIGRRDYVATVWSRTFILFLMGPILALGFGALFGILGSQADEEALRPTVAAVVKAEDAPGLQAAYDLVARRVGEASLPALRIETAGTDPAVQAAALLAEPGGKVAVVLTGWPGTPKLTGPGRIIQRLEGDVRLVLDEARTSALLADAGVSRPDIRFARTVIDPVGGGTSAARHLIARGGQTLLFMLTMLLAGMLLSNLVEEKSNKVIEVLAAAVPIDAIFLGKLVAMLAVSLTGIVVWGAMIAVGLIFLLPPGVPVPVPAIGWPLFAVLAVAYYVTNYMILGAAFLGIGAQANSVREVQTLSMPVTMAQLAVFALGSAAVNDLDGAVAHFAAVFPLSSPLAMLARAAQETAFWPHIAALLWQAVWVVLLIRFAARRFRVSVLKSGPAQPRKKRRFAFGRG